MSQFYDYWAKLPQPTEKLSRERFGQMRKTKLIGTLVLLVALFCFAFPVTAWSTPAVGVAVSIHIAPPILPVYAQPICPGSGYIWEPGYWAYGDAGYYWVPGIWVLPPRAGLLWTPGYWGFSNGIYIWNAGYWGISVGFYGGINYGFGYPGMGFYGGYWRGNQYFYNTRVTNINRTVVHNVYNQNVAGHTVSRASFNGPRGVNARPTGTELAAAHQAHVSMTSAQTQHQREAARTMVASANHGRPDVAANGRSNELSRRREAPGNNRSANAEHPAPTNRTPSAHTERPATPNTAPAAKSAPARTTSPRTEKPAATHATKPSPTRPERSSSPATKPAPTRSERPSAEHRSASKSTPAPSHATPSHTTKAPEHQPSAKPEASHTERQPAAKPSTHSSTTRPTREQSPSNSHPAAHTTQSHAAAPHAQASHPAASEQPHTNSSKPEHQEH